MGDAAILAATILGWDLIIDRLVFYVPVLEGPLRHRPIPIIRDGRLVVENARANLLTRTEIMARLRDEGLTSLDQVKESYLEQDGTFSIVPR